MAQFKLIFHCLCLTIKKRSPTLKPPFETFVHIDWQPPARREFRWREVKESCQEIKHHENMGFSKKIWTYMKIWFLLVLYSNNWNIGFSHLKMFGGFRWKNYFQGGFQERNFHFGKIVASGFQRDDKVEEISMQMLTGKPVERQNKVFKEIYSEPGVKTWKKTMGLRRQSCFW